MNIEVVEIKDRGDLKKERIVLKAVSDIDLGFYIAFLVKKTDSKTFSGKPQEVFWFPDKEVEQGDLVVLYTKSGTNTTKQNKSGNSTHFFYWNLDKSIFYEKSNHPIIIEANGWI